MIKTTLFNQIELLPTNRKVIEYINCNLLEILDLACDLAKEVGEDMYPYFFPYYRKHNDQQIYYNMLLDLKDLISSNGLRDNILPKYESLLFHILTWWKEFCDTFDIDLIPCKISEALKNEIELVEEYIDEDGENFIIHNITSFEYYLEFCFYDYDFLPEFIEEAAIIYMNDGKKYEKYLSDVELEEYIELLPNDLKEQLIKIESKRKTDIKISRGKRLMTIAEFVSSTLASGVAYDLIKAGTVLTGNHLKTLIKKVVLSDEEIDKLAGVYNRVLEDNEIATLDEYVELLSKNKLIKELCNKNSNSIYTEYNDSIVINSSGSGAVNAGRDVHIHNHYLAGEKK